MAGCCASLRAPCDEACQGPEVEKQEDKCPVEARAEEKRNKTAIHNLIAEYAILEPVRIVPFFCFE
jgi:hypothetical protein